MTVKVTNKDKMESFFTGGLYEEASGKLIMKDLGMVANHRTNYWGKNYRSRR